MTLRVDVWADVVCPWCYIGKRRFEEGLRRYRAEGGTLDVEVTYRSFLLAPDTPEGFEGSVADFLSVHKGMPPQDVQRMLEQVTAIAAAEGLTYDFDAAHHTTTLAAHEVLHLARAHGVQGDLVERLFRAYFTEGRRLDRAEELADLAADVGLDRAEVLAALADHRHRDDVEVDFTQARAFGITGVPFVVLDGRYGVSGAQDAAVFHQALVRAAEDRTDG
jgi:predicted DsbA family dithiol-disulfide isomerase